MSIDILSFLYLVIALWLIPIFILLSMILWRVFKMLDRVEAVLKVSEEAIYFAKNIDKIPAIVANKIISAVNNFIGK